jgi:hypothetical protein
VFNDSNLVIGSLSRIVQSVCYVFYYAQKGFIYKFNLEEILVVLTKEVSITRWFIHL